MLRIGSHLAKVAAVGAALVTAGCSGGGIIVAVSTNDMPPEVLVACPPSVVPQGRHFIQAYGAGLSGQPAGLRYQANITDNVRSCLTNPTTGVTTVTVTVRGRVLAGPAAIAGTVSLPVRVELTRDDAVIYSRVYNAAVTIGPGVGATFEFVDTGITFPYPEEPVDYEIVVGFAAL